MPLIKSHTDEARQKNIEEMIKAGHEPKQAVAAAYANQRKYKKMYDGGAVEKDYADEEEEIESQIQDSNRGLYELQEASHLDKQIGDGAEKHEMLAHALGKREHRAKDKEVGTEMGSDEIPSEVVALPASHYAEQAQELLKKRKKIKNIDTTEEEI